MQKLISRACCLCLVVLVIAACLPFSAFAVDPVSAGVMANAFAQAIAAYGASNGVALTFDVANTDGIGEGVHELWKDFREGTQSVDDYATLAAALFPDLYYKASSVVAGAADVYTVGYNISSEYAEEFDNFYNWLLSGPAEMTKVDNQYFEFSSAQVGPSSVPVSVSSISLSALNGYQVVPLPISIVADSYFGGSVTSTVTDTVTCDSDAYAFYCLTTNYLQLVVVSLSASTLTHIFTRSSGYTSTTSPNMSAQSGLYVCSIRSYVNNHSSSGEYPQAITLPVYNGSYTNLSAIFGDLSSPALSTTEDSLGVKAYGSSGIATFPDTTDPNYDAVAKQIPSTYPWNDSLYGDGTGALTDAQAGAIAGSVDDVLVVDGVVDLAGTREGTDEPGTDDPPSDDPDDYVVPGLADIFPFCIPFDIYNFLSALAAAPVAPHFTATLDFPEAVGGTQTIDIDFDSPTWNQLAQLLRLLELLAFIIGLALLTRSMFIRG